MKFTLRFRGREMAHQQLGREKLLRVADQLSDVGWIELEPRTEGRVMNLVLAPGARKKIIPTLSPPRPASPAATPATAARPSGAAAAKPEAPPSPPNPAH